MTDATNINTDEATPVEQPKQDKPKAKKPAAKATKKPAAKSTKTKAKQAKPKKAPEPSITSVLASELGVNSKILRAKLRRAGLKAPYTNIDKLRAALAKDDAKK